MKTFKKLFRNPLDQDYAKPPIDGLLSNVAIRLALSFVPTRIWKKMIGLSRFVLGIGQGAGTANYEGRLIASYINKHYKNRKSLFVFDVGYCRGAWTKGFIEKTNAEIFVFAFDPMLVDSTPPQGDKFKSYKLVLTDKKSKLDFYLDSSSALRMPGFLRSKISVSGERFDSILDGEKISKNLETLFVMKIDVEGFELNVLKGCGKYLEQIDIIQFEIGEFTQQANHSLRSFKDLIGPSYQFYVISTVYGLIPINPEEDSIYSNYLTANFVAIKKIEQK